MIHHAGFSHAVLSFPHVGACVGTAGFGGKPAPDVVLDRHAMTAITARGADVCYWHDAAGDDESPCHARELVKAYEECGGIGLVGFSERCAGFLSDRRRRRCLLFNDAYGSERIFLHVSGSRVFFSSEAKAILAVVPATREFDPLGLAELLACGCTLGTRSLFRNIDVLPGGTVLTFENGAVQRRRYFDPAQLEGLEPVSMPEFVEGFSSSLSTAVNRRLRGSGKVGVSLTGGLDSRMVMASLDAGPGDVPCYTFGSMYRTTGDVSVARQVASACRQPHQVIELGKEFLDNATEHLENAVYASDGYLGLSGAAELYCNRRARTIAPCRMTGNWGGELMRGVRAFRYGLPKGGFISRDLVDQVHLSAESFAPPSSNSLSAALFQQVPHQGYGRYAIERSQVRVTSPFLDADVVRWLYKAPPAIRESSTTAAAVIARRPELLDIPTDAGLLGVRPSRLRRMVRRSVVKAEYLTSHGAPDWFARISSALPAGVLETRFLGVDKFQHFRFWIRHDLAGLVRDTLFGQDRDELSTWFDMGRVRQMVAEHVEGRANHTDAIDKLLTVAVARRTLLGSRPHPSAAEFNQRELAL